MQYTEEMLKKVHNVETDILKAIINVCEKNNITYYIDWGTLLGAIRHKGFIPWDDDIDICMPRDDYELFSKIAKKELPKGYTWEHFSTNFNVPTYFGKVKKDNTKFVEEAYKNLSIHHGIFVDIFPVDVVPSDIKLQKKYCRKCRTLIKIYASKTIKEITTEKDPIKKFIYKCIRLFLHTILKFIPKQVLYKKLDFELRKYNSNEKDFLCCVGSYNGIQKYSDVFPLKKVEFEGIQVNGPNNCDVVLSKEYGNYMELPPKDQRVGHCPSILEV